MKTRATRTRLAVLSLLATLPLAAVAQSSPLGETVVTASRVEQPLAEVLPSVTLITREQIERSQAASLADLLQGEAGFEFGRNGGPGAVTSFFLRGAESKNLVIMIDGVRTMVDGIGSLAAIDLPLQAVDRIEMLHGNASALYGESAIGGVIQIFTRKLNGSPGAYGSATLGSRNASGLTAGYAGQDGEVSYRLDAGAEHTDGFSAMSPAQSAKVNPDADALDRSYVLGKLARRVSADLTLGLMVNTVRTDAAYDKNSDLSTDRHLLRTEYAMLNGYAEGKLNADWRSRMDVSRTNLAMRDYKNDMANRSTYNGGLIQVAQSALRWFNTYTVGSGGVVNFGAEAGNEAYSNDALDSSVGYQVARQSRGYFAGLNQNFGRLSLQANVRQDTVALDKANTAVSSRWGNTSGLLGLGYRLTDAWRLTGTVSTGFRAPSAAELSSNMDLNPETHLSQEVGVIYAANQVSLRAVAFDTRTRDALYYQSSTYKYVNIGKVRNQGVELSGSMSWSHNQVRYSLTSQDPWNESDNTRLARRARLYGSVDVSRLMGATTAGVKLYAADDRYDGPYSSSPDKMLPGYSTLALYASRALDRDWTLRFKVENALDRPYQLAYGYNTPPFGMWVTLAYQQH